MDDDFTMIPIIDLALAEAPATKPQFLLQLRNALVRVGFFYIKNHAITADMQQKAKDQSTQFFNLPLEKKLEVETLHSKHFVGYNRMDSEKTATQIDHNESIAIGSGLPAPNPDDPVYLNLQGPNQWPDKTEVPGFQDALENYFSAVQVLATDFTTLIAEALDMPANSFNRFIDDFPLSRLVVLRYPPPLNSSKAENGVAPHKDGVFMTYLLQLGEHRCLEVQNKSGVWIPVPPIPGTLVVNIGRLLETLTRGVCTATTHRVVLRSADFIDGSDNPLGARLSIPFFQYLNLELRLEDLYLDIPPHIADLVKGEKVISDAGTFFAGLSNNCAGDTVFVNMLTSYPDAAKKWYPDLLSLALKKEFETKQLDKQKQIS